MAFGFQIAEPNEALIVSGKKGKGDGSAEAQQYKIVPSGNRVFVIPILQRARNLPLDLHNALVPVECTTTQGIPVQIEGVVAFKVGSDNVSIANAAQRFLHDPDSMQDRVHEIFAGHIRGIVGSLTVEQLIRERESLTSQVLDATSTDMEVMGLKIDTLQIAGIRDPTGYIEKMAKPDLAKVDMAARIAQAASDREASEKEAENAAAVAEAQRSSRIRQAAAQAEVDKAQAEAAQAGPLAAAESEKAVVQKKTEVAELEASRTERELESTVKKPADAEAYRAKVEAQGQKDAAILRAEAEAETARRTGTAQAEIEKVQGEAQAAAREAQGLADAKVTQAQGEAEGNALKARAEGLAQNQEAVIGQQIAERLPDIVKAAASMFDNVEHMTVLNGAEGMAASLNSLLAVGGQIVATAREEFAKAATGAAEQESEPASIGVGNGGSTH
jgi:flotillin